MKNGALKIEKGIPIPENTRGGRNGAISGLMRQMKKGDSILLHCAPATARMHAHRNLGKGNYAAVTDESGTRVWKVK